MQEYLVRGVSLPDAYHEALLHLQHAPVIPCPEWNTNQKEVSMTMVVEEPLREDRISRLFYGGPSDLEQYIQEMLDGILDFEVEAGNWVYTYHSRYKDQFNFIVEELKRDLWSRRAVMDIRAPEDMGSNDPACWQHAQYFIRDGKLHCKILFRSNDACKAAFMNAYALIELQKRIADALGVPIGTYTHRANSFHCYERDFGLLDSYCSRIREFDEDPDTEITYSYEDDWKEQMEDAREEIEAKVRDLKKKCGIEV